MKFFKLFFLFFLFAAWGCENTNQAGNASSHKNKKIEKKISSPKTKTPLDVSSLRPSAPLFSLFYIFSDKASRFNHYVPSGFMPDGKCVYLNDFWTENCQSGNSCIKIIYDVECSNQNEKWAGIYWLNPANNWGRRKGGFNLSGASKLTFWAKGERGGEQIQEFTVGGISGDFPDSDMIVIGPVILTPEWKQYTIDLRGKDLSYISGGFAWTTNIEVNPHSCIFYLDEIKFE